jgi:hypothetical protein
MNAKNNGIEKPNKARSTMKAVIFSSLEGSGI